MDNIIKKLIDVIKKIEFWEGTMRMTNYVKLEKLNNSSAKVKQHFKLDGVPSSWNG
jgi:Holliday junction resolvase RusA-like endonuclease